MTGPKHLWSGNWQEESRHPAVPPAPAALPSAPGPVPVRRRRPPLWRTLLPAGALILVVAVALAELLPGGTHRPGHGATTPTISAVPGTQNPNPVVPTPTTTPGTSPGTTVRGHTVTWLGMQIATVENVGAVIETVQLGSPADAAGLDPGDIIQSVNHHPIAAADQIRSAVRDLKPGDAVLISVGRGSTLFATVADFSGQPVTSP